MSEQLSEQLSEGVVASKWSDAALAAALVAVDPAGLGGVALRALHGPVRDRWLAYLRALLAADAPFRRIPLHVSDDRLLGGLDLSATLRSGRPVAETGLLAEANRGVVVLSMADCIGPAMAARLATVLDTGEVALERDGLGMRIATRFGVVALDEAMSEDERPPLALLDRLAFHIDLSDIRVSQIDRFFYTADDVAAARSRLTRVDAGFDVTEALCATASALGIESVRAPLLALRAARALAALKGRAAVGSEEAAHAARLVFTSRATTLPAVADATPEEQGDADQKRDDTPASADDASTDDENAHGDPNRPLRDVVLSAVQAAIPAGLLDRLRSGTLAKSRWSSGGRSGALQKSRLRGRPIGAVKAELRCGTRLNVIETLRAAAPWQRLRARVGTTNAATDFTTPHAPSRIQVRPDDFRITRFKQRAQTTTIFVVDASGSAALHRLAEAKGAVELLLADSYVRRDRVALISFRAQAAELLLPPTRSLVRAKRCLSSLPGGGGTPLAAGIDAASTLADTLHRRGDTPIIVMLTDGRANVARDGSAGREQAMQDSKSAARQLRGAGFAAVLIDTSPRPQPLAEQLAAEMNATYLPLPHADAGALSRAIRIASPSSIR